MLIALLSILIVLCGIQLLCFLWERRKCIRVQRRLFRESRKLAHTNHIASAILKNVHAYILLIDNDFKVLKTNYYQKTGTKKGLEDKRVGDLLQCHNALSAPNGCGTHQLCSACPVRAAIRQAFKQRKNFTDLEATLNIAISENETVACNVVISGSFFLLDRKENMVLTVHDVTRLKKVEEELKRAKEKAEKADISKSAFLANMSHEIRTPLNSIVGFSQILSSYYGDNEDTKEYAHIIEQNSTNLLQLINDVLDLSYLDGEQNIPAETIADITGVCQTCIDQAYSYLKPNVQLIFTPERENFSMQTNPERISQVLMNLLQNAAKFTTHGSISLSYHIREEEKMILFSVTDTGIGIPIEKQESVFERFNKLDTFVPGTGLGLSISRLIAEKMGGSLTIDSTYTTGSRFILILPLKE